MCSQVPDVLNNTVLRQLRDLSARKHYGPIKRAAYCIWYISLNGIAWVAGVETVTAGVDGSRCRPRDPKDAPAIIALDFEYN